jgi:anti-sigma B factor antagonist
VTFLLHEPTGKPPVVRAEGELDMAAAPGIKETLAQLIIDSHRSVVLDLSEATFVDSTTIGTLMAAHQRLKRYGSRLDIVCTNENILRTFEFAGLRDELNLHESLDALMHPAGQSA